MLTIMGVIEHELNVCEEFIENLEKNVEEYDFMILTLVSGKNTFNQKIVKEGDFYIPATLINSRFLEPEKIPKKDFLSDLRLVLLDALETNDFVHFLGYKTRTITCD